MNSGSYRRPRKKDHSMHRWSMVKE